MNTETDKQPRDEASLLNDYALEKRVLADCACGNAPLAEHRAGGITDDCFTFPAFRQLFRRLCELDRNAVVFSPANLYRELGQPLLEALGDFSGVLSMQAETIICRSIPGMMHVDRERLIGLMRKRKMRDAAAALASAIERGAGVQAARRALLELEEAAETRAPTAALPCAETTALAMEGISAALRAEGMSGVPTGFPTLDMLTGGLQPGHYYVAGARPGVGKTALALNIALAVAERGKRVLFATAEMSPPQLMERLMSIIGKVNMRELRNPAAKPTKRALRDAYKACGHLKKLHIDTLDASGWSVEALADAIRLEHRRAPLALVVVDYLGLLKCDSLPAQASAFDTTTEVTKELCRAAKRTGVPLLALSQLSRSAGKGAPTLTDLRQSGQIEQDADMVLLLDRPETRLPEGEERDKARGLARLDIAKNRHGEAGVAIPMSYTGGHLTFAEA